MAYVNVTFKVTGTSPLLQHNPSAMQPPEEEGKPKGGVLRKIIPTPEQEAEAGCYRLPSGQLYLPARAVRKMLYNAAKYKRIGKVPATTIVKSGIFSTDEILPLVHPKTKKPVKDYTIDTQPVKLKQGISILRSRPMIAEWEFNVTFDMEDEIVTASQLQELMNMGGARVGLLELRPERGGSLGRMKAHVVEKS